jgi:hypothetical protein
MPSVGWGNNYNLNDHVLVGGNDEIPIGNYAYVFNMQAQNSVATIPKAMWEAMLNGDFTSVKNQIEQGIPSCQVKMIHCAWDKADYIWWMGAYAVAGFRVEALVYNAGAHQTGLEIVAIIIAVAFIIAVITACVVGGWVVWQVVSAAQSISPVVTIGVGLAILAGIAILAFVLIGGRAQYKGKKRRITIGKEG